VCNKERGGWPEVKVVMGQDVAEFYHLCILCHKLANYSGDGGVA
jgi:5'-deoxynucleotidase YfbR-like HD superfamily hydrolase